MRQNGRTASFSASVPLPSGTGPFPAVVYSGIGIGIDTNTIATCNGSANQRWTKA
ncbi:hypothetical protein J5X84_37005 [Streptosporangiaceae bacterium NEAU-GS5]|nr:hypothetical protein [Streptosporangiaceae bacterium NEAU-GS5]